ncbi:MAG: apolipoprotein N-acyltransferase [Spirochaetales bacterium]|nr:MAG: apolipoprotein N-acyltransferase [Spirochaetales bacterium]
MWGWFPLAYIALVPVAVLIHRVRWPEVFIYGFIYGLTTYTIHNYWLSGFHPLAVVAVPLIYATYFLFFFPLLKLADTLMPKYGYLLQVAIWLAYEYFRTQFYLGYAYGIIGYTQFLFLPLIRVSSVTGVWGVSLLVAFPGFYLGSALRDGWAGLTEFVRRHRIEAVAWAAVFMLAVVYGIVTKVDYSESRTWRVALVQQNSDPMAGGAVAYQRSLDISLRLSNDALEHDPDVIVWSETSVVPPIDYHFRYRTNRDSFGIVEQLLEFLDTQDTPYVIGNSSARLLRNEEGNLKRVDYNAVIVYDDGAFSEPYRKTHLVPFTEHFPFQKQLPGLYKLLVENGTNSWGQGDTYTVFEVDGVKFSTPICFEDTFGYITREFVNRGAEVIVNLTNDLWSKSVAASMQHMQMAVFRATETRRSLVRSTNGGMTSIVDPNGKITGIYPPFVEGYLLGDVPVYKEGTTLYVKWGDWFAWMMIGIAVAGLLAAVVVRFVRARAR